MAALAWLSRGAVPAAAQDAGGGGVGAAEPAPVAAEPAAAPAEPAPAAGPLTTDGAPRPTGFALGVELGQPVGVSGRWAGLDGRLAVDLGLGTGTWDGAGVAVHADVSTSPLVLARGRRAALLHVGVGVRHYHHGYAPASVDELPDAHLGVRGTLGVSVALAGPRLELFAAVQPGYDLWRSSSCSLASGANSVCPHAQAGRAFLDGVLGVRWWLGGR